jgi:hypothetical protein
MAGIDDWDRAALPVLNEKGTADASALVTHVGIDQFDFGMAEAWLQDAMGRGLVHRVEGPPVDARYELTEKGRARMRRLSEKVGN